MTFVPVPTYNGKTIPRASADGLIWAKNSANVIVDQDVMDALKTQCDLPEDLIWPWLREQLIERPEYVAMMTGIPEVAALRNLPIPKQSLKLSVITEAYERENPSKERSKREALAVFNRLVEHTGASKLDDLTQEKLLAFRREVETSDTLKSPATRAAYYGRIKTIISFGLKVGMDQQQIHAALERCGVLWTSDPLPVVKPKPISRQDWDTLLKSADDGPWRAWLLLGLNLCMSIEEVCGLQWENFDLEKGTFAAIREKTRRDRIPRAAVLWPETIEVLSKLSRKGPHVFTSKHGNRFNRNTRVNDFAEFRNNANLPDAITFGTLRDGAYSIACQMATDERWARVLAGHRAAGLQDNYVLRNPDVTRQPCEAVWKHYMGANDKAK